MSVNKESGYQTFLTARRLVPSLMLDGEERVLHLQCYYLSRKWNTQHRQYTLTDPEGSAALLWR